VCISPFQRATTIDNDQGHYVTLPRDKYVRGEFDEAVDLIAEHVENDGRWYRRIIDVYMDTSVFRGLICPLKARHGGGSSVISHLPEIRENTRPTYLIVDSDRSLLSEDHGALAKDVCEAVWGFRLIAKPHTGLSDVRPLFGLGISAYRNVSNTVPPEMVNLYYAEIARNPQQLNAFVSAFDAFPLLSDDEWRVWLGINFETPPSRTAFESIFAGRISPAVLSRIGQQLDLVPPRISKNVTANILRWCARVGGDSKISNIIERALSASEYKLAIEKSLLEPIHLGLAFGPAAL
jgi:hypothetical protein